MVLTLLRLILAVTTLAGCRSIPDAAEDRPRRLVLLYTGDLHGVTEPCGCTADILLGGIDRLGRRVASARAQAGARALLVDAGNVISASPRVAAERRAQEHARAEVISQAFLQMAYDGVAVGPYDLAFGVEGVRRAGAQGRLPWLSANLQALEAPWRPWRLVEAGGLRVAIVGLTDPELVPSTPGVSVRPMVEGLREALAQIRPAGPDLVVGIGAVDRRRLRRLLKEVPGIDVFVRSHGTQRDDTPRQAGTAWIVEPHEEAQSLGRVRIGLSATPAALIPAGLSVSERERLDRRRAFLAKAGRTEALAEVDAQLRAPAMAANPAPDAGAFTVELLPVTPDLQPIPELAALRTGFNRRLGEINLAHATPPPPVAEGASGYAGVEECAMCHDEEEAFWKTTRHGHALATLVERDKQFDEECIACHVTGYRAPGGSSLGHLGALQDVQCESCHGASSLHADDGERASAPLPTVAPSVCVGCHNAKHSPKFDYVAWKARIVGPGHGRPSP